LELKGARRLKNNTSGSNTDPRVKWRKRHGTTRYERISGSIEGSKGERSNRSDSAVTERSATEQNGN